MTDHTWRTYQSNDNKRHDECLYCPARRIQGVNTNWQWRYTVLGEKTCTGAHDPSSKERALMAEEQK